MVGTSARFGAPWWIALLLVGCGETSEETAEPSGASDPAVTQAEAEQVAEPTVAEEPPTHAAPAPELPNEGFHAEEVSGGAGFTCARLEAGVVHCWGSASRLGIGEDAEPTARPTAPVEGITDAQQLSCGLGSCCVLREGGTVSCWGDNRAGKLGDGSTDERRSPVVVRGLNDATHVQVGARHACAVRQDGKLSCWGSNSSGELGDGSTEDRTRPVEVRGLEGPVAQVALANGTTCARMESGQVFCWGSNNWNRLLHRFDTITARSTEPVAATGMADVVDLSAGADFFCAVRRDGSAACWGKGGHGQIGNGSTEGTSATAGDVAGLTGIAQIAASHLHTCARLSSGALHCWGINRSGELGDASYEEQSRTTPGPVPGFTDAQAVFSRRGGTCARRASGVILCWGINNNGELGNGTTRENSAAPVAVLPIATEAAE